MNYTPDTWVILKFSGSKVPDGIMYKVLAGWYGGFADGDSWKLNSGITEIVTYASHYEVKGYSGSTYICHKGAETMSMYMASIYNSLLEQSKDTDTKIEIVQMLNICHSFGDINE